MHERNQVRSRKLQNAMVAAGMSVRELVHSTNFLRHQIDAAMSGDARISDATYSVLMNHIAEYKNKETKITQIVKREEP